MTNNRPKHISKNLSLKALGEINRDSDSNIRTLATKTAIAVHCLKTVLSTAEHALLATMHRKKKQNSFNVVNHTINSMIED